MLAFDPTDRVIFKHNGIELELTGIFDSQDWNPNEAKVSVFEFHQKTAGGNDAE